MACYLDEREKKMIAPNNFFINLLMLRSLKATYNFS